MVKLPNHRLLLASVLFTAGLGCAHRKPAPAPMVYRPAPTPAPPPPPPVKLAKVVVLPVDKLALPGTADELNAKLAQLRLAGAEAPTLATISMETALLQAECAEPGESCYTKIARLVDTDRLVWAEVEKTGAKGPSKKKAKKSETKIQVVLFDRDKLAVVGRADETFPAAITGEQLDKLIATAVGANAAPVAPPERPVYAPQPPPGYGAQPGYAAQPQPGYAQQPRPGYAAQPQARPAPAYGTQPQPGYAQPNQPGYAQPAQPTYAQPAQPGYAQPAAPASVPATAPTYQAPVATPPAAPAAPTPAAPTAPAPTAPGIVPGSWR
jgi:hypothetical protein